jgi:DNA-binding NtrC family response regulator
MSSTRPLALVAEDTELGRWAIAHALQAGGYETRVSAGWAETAGWLDRKEFDVAVMSLSCDRDDVAHIAEHLRIHHGSAGLIFLVLQEDVEAVRLACGPGPIVLAKPLDIERLVQAARKLRQPGPVGLEAGTCCIAGPDRRIRRTGAEGP